MVLEMSTTMILVLGVAGMGAMCLCSCSAGLVLMQQQSSSASVLSAAASATAPAAAAAPVVDCVAKAKTDCDGKRGKERDTCLAASKKACAGVVGGSSGCDVAGKEGKLQRVDDSEQRVLTMAKNKDAWTPIIQGKNNSCSYDGSANQHQFVALDATAKTFKILKKPTSGSGGRYLVGDCATWPYTKYAGDSADAWVAEPASGTDCGAFFLRNVGCNKYLGNSGVQWGGAGDKSNWAALTDKANAQKFWMDTTSCVSK